MTQLQKTQIAQLRSKGFGYKAIADRLYLSKDCVKMYCRRHGIIKEPLGSNNSEGKGFCQNCGKPFTFVIGRKLKKFCSKECGLVWWNAHSSKMNHRNTYYFICATCGKAFTDYRNRQRKYCSIACSSESHRKGNSNAA